MPDVVRALVGHEEPEGRRHQLADTVECARTRRGHPDLLDVGAEGGVVDRPIAHGRRGQRRGTEGRDDRVRLPMAARRVIPNARPTQAAGIAA